MSEQGAQGQGKSSILTPRDFLIAGLLGLAAAASSFSLSGRIDPEIFTQVGWDTYFESDLPRIYRNLTDIESDYRRTDVHPLFPLIAYPAVQGIAKIASLKPLTAIRTVTSIVSALWAGLLFLLLRVLFRRSVDAVLLTLLTAVSGATIFWFAVPETYSFGSVSIIAAMLLVALSEYRKVSLAWYVLVSIATLSFTVTNWMAGLLASFTALRWRRALLVTVLAFAAVSGLWLGQKLIFPSARFFLDWREEHHFAFGRDIKQFQTAWEPHKAIRSFLFHSTIVPEVKEDPHPYGGKFRRGLPVLSTQGSSPGSGGYCGLVSVILWVVLLAVGVAGFFTTKKLRRFRIVLGLLLLGQLLLHAVYGDETFLYSLHFQFLLVIMVGFAMCTRFRTVALGLVAVLIVLLTINNLSGFAFAARYFQRHQMRWDFRPQRVQLLEAMTNRPGDPWPRGEGHVVLGLPGTKETSKAYHEPGGSFSPSGRSFGISLWVTDKEGNILDTSDGIDLEKIEQRFQWQEGLQIPAVVTDTPYYTTTWSLKQHRQWKLGIRNKTKANQELSLVISSAGPAGGPIDLLEWKKGQLCINERWSLDTSERPVEVTSGSGGLAGYFGWENARLVLPKGDLDVLISDTQPSKELIAAYPARLSLRIDLPDRRFLESLEAQVAHLMMSLVGRETRPADPMNYPLQELRDGAYVVVALARAGQVQLAMDLSMNFAENDFFGGFGPEADAPGLALWVLEELAARAKDPSYDKWAFPHVERKAE